MLYCEALQTFAGVEEQSAAVEEEQGSGDGVARVGAEADDLMRFFEIEFFLFRLVPR